MCITNDTAKKHVKKTSFSTLYCISLKASLCAIEFVEGNQTPKEGYKSITVKTEIYDYYYNQYLKVKDEYALKGIHSFSAYITHILFQLIEQEKNKKTQT